MKSVLLLFCLLVQQAGASGGCEHDLGDSIKVDSAGNLHFPKNTAEFRSWRRAQPPHIPDSAYAFARLSPTQAWSAIVRQKGVIDRQLGLVMSENAVEGELEDEFSKLLAPLQSGRPFRGDINLQYKYLILEKAGKFHVVLHRPGYGHEQVFTHLRLKNPGLILVGGGGFMVDLLGVADGKIDVYYDLTELNVHMDEETRTYYKPNLLGPSAVQRSYIVDRFTAHLHSMFGSKINSIADLMKARHEANPYE